MSRNTQTEINLRLKMLCEMLPSCSCIGDVGTDHGFLPIYAIHTGKCNTAVASDLREGPLSIAKKNISEACLEKQIETVLCPGLSGYIDKKCEAIVIAGMGGLTVCSILADWLIQCEEHKYYPGNILFVLQPNTHEHEVRKFLWEHLFAIEDEKAIRDGNHVYAGFKCRFVNKKEEYTEVQCYTGKIMNKRLSENDIIYFNAILKKYKNVLNGLSKRVSSDEDTLKRIELCRKIILETEYILKIDKL